MKFLATVATLILIAAWLSVPRPTSYRTFEYIEKPPRVTHQQSIWLAALEWCESSGRKDAINKVDLDGTPSYYSFQFKPGTFMMYGTRYGVIDTSTTALGLMEKMKDYKLQKDIMEAMINDSKVRWEREFPACVKKLGRPPKK